MKKTKSEKQSHWGNRWTSAGWVDLQPACGAMIIHRVVVIVPMSINKFNTKQSQSRERYNNAYNLYVELADIICSMMNGQK